MKKIIFILLVFSFAIVAKANAPQEDSPVIAVASSELCNVVIDIHVQGEFLHGWAEYYDGTRWVYTDLRVISNYFTVQKGTVISVGVAAWKDAEQTDVYTNNFYYRIDSDQYITITAY